MKEVADPFIIAMAKAREGNITNSKPIIVTDENQNKKNRIPFVAKAYGIDSVKLTGMFKSEKWIF